MHTLTSKYVYDESTNSILWYCKRKTKPCGSADQRGEKIQKLRKKESGFYCNAWHSANVCVYVWMCCNIAICNVQQGENRIYIWGFRQQYAAPLQKYASICDGIFFTNSKLLIYVHVDVPCAVCHLLPETYNNTIDRVNKIWCEFLIPKFVSTLFVGIAYLSICITSVLIAVMMLNNLNFDCITFWHLHKKKVCTKKY